MSRILASAFVAIFLVGCATKPPPLPEPKGPLVKANLNQPHETFGGKNK